VGDGSFIRSTADLNPDYQTTYHTFQNGKLDRLACIREDSRPDGHSKLRVISSLAARGRTANPDRLADMRQAAEWLADRHHNSRQGVWRLDELSAEIDRLVALTQPLVAGESGLAERLANFRLRYLEQVSAVPLPRVSEQGDFTPANLLIEAPSRLKVIDWGHARNPGQPLLDIGSFYFALLRRQSPQRDQAVAAFLSAYQERSAGDLPVHLAPAYYLLRMIERALPDQDRHADKTLIIQGWVKHLSPALRVVTAAQPVTGETTNELLRDAVQV
jgi:hypothetical protein